MCFQTWCLKASGSISIIHRDVVSSDAPKYMRMETRSERVQACQQCHPEDGVGMLALSPFLDKTEGREPRGCPTPQLYAKRLEC